MTAGDLPGRGTAQAAGSATAPDAHGADGKDAAGPRATTGPAATTHPATTHPVPGPATGSAPGVVAEPAPAPDPVTGPVAEPATDPATKPTAPAPGRTPAPRSAPAPRGEGSAVGWALLVCGTLLLVSVAVDAVSGDGFAWFTLAWVLILLPEAVRKVHLGRGDTRRADKTDPLMVGGAVVAAVICWAGLIYDWASGNGTHWLVLAATVLMTLGGVVWLFRRLTPSR
ncbi:hypothetical protein ACMA1D_03100 [Streptomyces sp. 796.1]|uniref:hypothetical protein n=1 Tax=Streptomyces sp. 796.1 TaxID=3163029 RepID=UPI0039C9ABFF